MSENMIFSLSLTIACFLMYGLKNRTYRKWFGILFLIVGMTLVFTVMPNVDEVDYGIGFFVMWWLGLGLFFERDRYQEDE
ncbi:MAG: hypothetical protein ACOH2R_19930 [Pseudomonas sp.]